MENKITITLPIINGEQLITSEVWDSFSNDYISSILSKEKQKAFDTPDEATNFKEEVAINSGEVISQVFDDETEKQVITYKELIDNPISKEEYGKKKFLEWNLNELKRRAVIKKLAPIEVRQKQEKAEAEAELANLVIENAEVE